MALNGPAFFSPKSEALPNTAHYTQTLRMSGNDFVQRTPCIPWCAQPERSHSTGRDNDEAHAQSFHAMHMALAACSRSVTLKRAPSASCIPYPLCLGLTSNVARFRYPTLKLIGGKLKAAVDFDRDRSVQGFAEFLEHHVPEEEPAEADAEAKSEL